MVDTIWAITCTVAVVAAVLFYNIELFGWN